MGRPVKLTETPETLRTLAALGKIQATTRETAAVLSVSHGTLLGFLNRSKKAKAAYEDGKETGRASLRRWQFQGAEKGNTTMMIWLGKQYLGQSDKQELAHSPTEAFKAIWESMAKAGAK